MPAILRLSPVIFWGEATRGASALPLFRPAGSQYQLTGFLSSRTVVGSFRNRARTLRVCSRERTSSASCRSYAARICLLARSSTAAFFFTASNSFRNSAVRNLDNGKACAALLILAIWPFLCSLVRSGAYHIYTRPALTY